VVLLLFFLAALANVCYCAVYAIDLFVCLSGFKTLGQGVESLFC